MGITNQYLGNPNLKKAFVTQEFTKEQILEYQKCMKDPQYFIETYIKIVSLDRGLISFDMYPFQKDMVGTFHNNRFSICKFPRQSGKTTTMLSYILHYVILYLRKVSNKTRTRSTARRGSADSYSIRKHWSK